MTAESRQQVLGLVGSPRLGMNTATLVDRVLQGAAATGVATKLVHLSELTIEPCDACNGCKDTGQCVKQDGMQAICDDLEASGALVLGTPIYFDHISAQTKLFIDRLYPYLGPDMEHRFPQGVKAVLAATWEAEGARAYDGVVDWLRDRLSYYFDIEAVGVLTAADTGNRPVWDRHDLLKEADGLGTLLGNGLQDDPG